MQEACARAPAGIAEADAPLLLPAPLASVYLRPFELPFLDLYAHTLQSLAVPKLGVTNHQADTPLTLATGKPGYNQERVQGCSSRQEQEPA